MAEILQVFVGEESDPVSVGYVMDSNQEAIKELVDFILKTFAVDFSKLPLLIQHKNGTVRAISLARLQGKIKPKTPPDIYTRILKV